MTMNRDRWENGNDVCSMLSHLLNGASLRKLMQFDVGFERLFDPDQLGQRSQQFNQWMESWADDPVQRESFVNDPSWGWSPSQVLGWFQQERERLSPTVTAGAADLLRCVFGNPFVPPLAISPAWQTDDLVQLAKSIYDDRPLPAGTLNPDRLRTLADLLGELGSAVLTLQNHLRRSTPHIRGCWVIDLLLGKD